jgi:hypothetical protein
MAVAIPSSTPDRANPAQNRGTRPLRRPPWPVADNLTEAEIPLSHRALGPAPGREPATDQTVSHRRFRMPGTPYGILLARK